MNILALDLGTNCGWAMQTSEGRNSGGWVLAKDKEITEFRKQHLDRIGDPRIYRLLDLLEQEDFIHFFDLVVWEDVQFSSYTLQTQLWASFRTAIWATFGPNRKKLPVDVGTLKAFATGHGGATKAMMAAWLMKKHPHWYVAGPKPDTLRKKATNEIVYDDEIDACHLLDFAIQYHTK